MRVTTSFARTRQILKETKLPMFAPKIVTAQPPKRPYKRGEGLIKMNVTFLVPRGHIDCKVTVDHVEE